MAPKVIVFTRKFRGVPGYDLIVRDEDATVQDYLNALHAAIARLPLARTRRRGAQGRQGNFAPGCFGCDRCCAERAPLTLIDCLRLREAGGRVAGGGTGKEDPEDRLPSWEEFFDRYTTVTVRGPVVDIVLKRAEDGRCIFLDRQTKLCRVYRARPFVCRTFICSPAARRALALREAVVNKGEDELVRLWFTAGMVIHQADSPRPDPRDWPPTPFAGKTRYSEVRLKDVLPGKVWRNVCCFQKR